MNEEESKGLALMDEGNKALKRMSMWNLVSTGQKYEDAREKYLKAANLFKMVKSWENAAIAFEKSAEMDDNLDSQHEAVNNRVNAAECWKRCQPNKAIAMFKRVAQKNCEIGRFGRAAGYLESAAELLENEQQIGDAIELYSKAADYHFGENSSSKGAKCLEKVALLSTQLKQYDKSAQIFEQLGSTALESKLLSFGAKKHFMHAGFCLLARGDVVATRIACDRFAQMDLSFGQSREGQLLSELVVAVENIDPDSFSEALAKYDRVQTLDAWETSVLLKVKQDLETESNATPNLQ